MGKQYRHVEHGKEAIVGVLGPGHFCGEGCLNGHPLRVTTATAMEPSEVTRIAKAAMIAALHDHPEFSELFMADLLSRTSRIEEDLIDQLFNSSEKRLARALLLLANFGKKATTEPISGNISQENSCRDDRNDSVAREPLHEQVSRTRLHRLQWSPRSP
jgi:CRP/FNR family transcriptional regulator, cyclic AMP receptor protein